MLETNLYQNYELPSREKLKAVFVSKSPHILKVRVYLTQDKLVNIV